MTTTKDVIRQASLFTMNGLMDPRLTPEKIKATNEKSSIRSWLKKFYERIEMILSLSKGWQ